MNEQNRGFQEALLYSFSRSIFKRRSCRQSQLHFDSGPRVVESARGGIGVVYEGQGDLIASSNFLVTLW